MHTSGSCPYGSYSTMRCTLPLVDRSTHVSITCHATGPTRPRPQNGESE